MDGHQNQIVTNTCGVHIRSIGGRTGPEETSHKETLDGLLVEYTPEEIAYFNYLGDVWVGKY